MPIKKWADKADAFLEEIERADLLPGEKVSVLAIVRDACAERFAAAMENLVTAEPANPPRNPAPAAPPEWFRESLFIFGVSARPYVGDAVHRRQHMTTDEALCGERLTNTLTRLPREHGMLSAGADLCPACVRRYQEISDG